MPGPKIQAYQINIQSFVVKPLLSVYVNRFAEMENGLSNVWHQPHGVDWSGSCSFPRNIGKKISVSTGPSPFKLNHHR